MESEFGSGSNTSGVRRSLNGPEVNQLCGISRQWRGILVKRGVLPQPHFITASSRPRWWLDEVLSALAKIRPDAERTAAERSKRMRELRELQDRAAA